MEIKKENRAGVVGTILFHAILIIALVFVAFSKPEPTYPDPEGITVDLGYEETGMGQEEPKISEVVEAPQQQEEVVEEQPVEEVVKPSADPAVLTQEEASILEEQKKKEKQIAEEKRLKELEKKRLEEIERKKAEEARIKKEKEEALIKERNEKMKNAFGQNTTGNSTSQGINGGNGNQGDPNGTPGVNNYQGGGTGDGYKWSLVGRGKVSIPPAKKGIQEYGTVVVEIYVDKSGKVISARPGVQGTTNNNAELYEAAKQAALLARFTVSDSAPDRQKGTITYIFELE